MTSRDALYETPPEGFVAARDALVKELRAQGRAAEAREVSALRRPTPAVWALNQVARREPKAIEALLAGTRALREAQGARATPEALRAAMKEHRDALAAVGRAAEAALRAAGHEVPLALARRLTDTAQGAALADEQRLREGTLEREEQAAGFGALLGGDLGAPAPSAEAREQESPAERERQRAEEEARAEAQRKVAAAEREAARLAKRAEEAEEKATHARAAADTATLKAREARAAADEAARQAASLRDALK